MRRLGIVIVYLLACVAISVVVGALTWAFSVAGLPPGIAGGFATTLTTSAMLLGVAYLRDDP